MLSATDDPASRATDPLRASRRHLLGVFLGGAAFGLLPGTRAMAQPYGGEASKWTMHVKTGPRPRFAPTVEEFPIQLPPGKQLGRSVAVAVAPNGDIFLLHNSESGHTIPPKEARLPRVVRLSSTGKFISAWGGPDQAPAVDGVAQWPESYENLEVDDEGNVWIGGWAKSDDALLKFSPEGKFLRRYGQRFLAGNDASTDLFAVPASCYFDVKTRELFIADGYVNHRIFAINADTGKFTRMWGAYGQNPATLATDNAYGNPVHKIARAPDGLMYVCDRLKDRVQEFELIPGGVRYLREVAIAPGTGGQGSAFDVAFTPDNKYMFVADGMNMRVWTVDRKTLQVLGWASAGPETEGDYNIAHDLSELHRFARLQNGDLLLARVRPGLQVMKYLGVR